MKKLLIALFCVAMVMGVVAPAMAYGPGKILYCGQATIWAGQMEVELPVEAYPQSGTPAQGMIFGGGSFSGNNKQQVYFSTVRAGHPVIRRATSDTSMNKTFVYISVGVE